MESINLNLGRVLVAERGPLAGYLIRSLKRLGMETVAIAPDPVAPVSYNEDADFFVQLLGGETDFREALLEVAVDAGCDAVHPGYGPLAESVGFAQQLGSARVGFVGPQPEVIEALSDRWMVREMAVQAGLPVIPGTEPLQRSEMIRAEAQRLGLPVWLKDSTGRRPVCLSSLELVEQVASIRLSSEEGPVWLEKHIENARHLVVSFVSDAHGEMVTLPLHQTVLRSTHEMVNSGSRPTTRDSEWGDEILACPSMLRGA